MSKEKTEEKRRPIYTVYLSEGEGKGVQLAVWDNGVSVQVREKKGDQWSTSASFNFSRRRLEWFIIQALQALNAMPREEK